MPANKNCCFLFFDYTDYDVFLNARIFYRLAGYNLTSSKKLLQSDLLVIFRGIPDAIYSEYRGVIHVYDYVCEHKYNIREYFPNASSILVVSIHQHLSNESWSRPIYGYLPVIPSLWQFRLPFTRRSSTPIHVSNYKPLIDDAYQDQLIALAKSGKMRIYGGKWDRVEIKAHPLSYLAANLKLAESYICYGLMYPYQRGKSLSGRMWQAPIQGCLVVSEKSTNPFFCPGVLEVSDFNVLPPSSLLHHPIELAKEATIFWMEKTEQLESDLNLTLQWQYLWVEIFYNRLLMLSQHLEFFWKLLISPRIKNLKIRSKEFLRKLIKRTTTV
jgi:hypothetical protein